MSRRSGRLPDFLIVGAPKSGTTAAAAALAGHPEIFLSPLKEPKFLSAGAVPQPLEGPGDALIDSLRVRDEPSYRRLFRRAGDARAVGEASVDTLYYHRRTVPRIRRLLGSPRILVFLRNPVERAFSAWKQLVRDGRETASFEDGVDREARGDAERREFMWSYLGVGRYAEQVAAFTDAFPAVHVVLHDELRDDPPRELARITEFLGVDTDHRFRFQAVHNPSAIPRHPIARRLFAVGPVKVTMFRALLRLGLSEHRLLAAVDRLRPRHADQVEGIAMAAETRRRLEAAFEPEVRRLESVLGRSLDGWRS
jgi:hypothetical protein